MQIDLRVSAICCLALLLFASQVSAANPAQLSAFKRTLQCPACDLKGMVAQTEGAEDLSYAILSGADLKDADLRGANLSHADLRRTNLDGANLAGANLSGAFLEGASLKDANLKGADLSHASALGANFYCADLRLANLSEAYLVSVIFTGTNLWGIHTNAATQATDLRMGGSEPHCAAQDDVGGKTWDFMRRHSRGSGSFQGITDEWSDNRGQLDTFLNANGRVFKMVLLPFYAAWKPMEAPQVFGKTVYNAMLSSLAMFSAGMFRPAYVRRGEVVPEPRSQMDARILEISSFRGGISAEPGLITVLWFKPIQVSRERFLWQSLTALEPEADSADSDRMDAAGGKGLDHNGPSPGIEAR